MSTPTPLQLLETWQAQPLPWALTLGSGAIYLRGAARAQRTWPAWRTLSFLGGLATILVALQSGVDAWDDRLLSAHMVQHVLLLCVAPVLLVAGWPERLALRAGPRTLRRPLGRALVSLRMHPVGLLALFVGVVAVTHVPAVFDATLRNGTLHELEHAAYLFAGCLLWWPLLGAATERRLGAIGQVGYVIVAMAPMGFVGALLSWMPTVAYAPYAAPARALGISAVADQQQAAAIMWVGGNVFMSLVLLASVAAALQREERALRRRERWADLREAGL